MTVHCRLGIPIVVFFCGVIHHTLSQNNSCMHRGTLACGRGCGVCVLQKGLVVGPGSSACTLCACVCVICSGVGSCRCWKACRCSDSDPLT